MVGVVPRTIELPRDPKDEPYINLALASGARYLVTRDKDVLDFRDDEPLRRHAPNLSIVDPVALLRELAVGCRRGRAPEQIPEDEGEGEGPP